MTVDAESTRQLVRSLQRVSDEIARDATRCRSTLRPAAYVGPGATAAAHRMNEFSAQLQHNSDELERLAKLIAQRHLPS